MNLENLALLFDVHPGLLTSSHHRNCINTTIGNKNRLIPFTYKLFLQSLTKQYFISQSTTKLSTLTERNVNKEMYCKPRTLQVEPGLRNKL